MRVITINVNGIRAAARKGFFQWMLAQQADVVCVQETKAQMKLLTDEILRPAGYYCHFHDAQKKGYSGVGIYAKCQPQAVSYGLGWPAADNEGRYIQFDFEKLSIASIYLPSGSSGEERQRVKFEFMEHYHSILSKIQSSGRQFIICGDWNIVHTAKDIKNFKSNQKNSGCLPEERQWLDELFSRQGYVDAFRAVNQEPDQYTWWSNRGQAWQKNVGWRIDYQIITPGLAKCVESATIYKDQRFSDHAPLIIDYSDCNVSMGLS